jgi:hypothetical protein
LAQSKTSVGAALIAARKLAASNPHAATLLTVSAHKAFFDGFRVGCLVAAGVALAGAIFVAAFLPAYPTQSADEELLELVHAGQIDSLEIT